MSNIGTSIRKLYHTALPLQLKYGDGFSRKFRFYCEHQHVSREEIEHYQWARLKALIEYAYAHVPFYQRLFSQHHLHPNDIKSRADFSRIPALYKDDVVANHELLKSDEFDKLHPIQTTTSATTRDGMVMYRSQHSETVRRAVVWRFWHNLGYHFRDRRVHFTLNKRPNCDYMVPHVDLNENCIQFDPRSITIENAPAIYRRIKEFQPKMLFSQPATLVAIIYQWRQHAFPPLHVPLICVMGEKTYPEYREIISNFLGGNIHDYYGNRENTASAGELDDGRLYINDDFVYMEFESDDKRAVQNEPSNIITTGYENYAFPLIRYHTDDVGIDRGFPDNSLAPFATMEVVGGRGRDLLLSSKGLFCPNILAQLRAVKFDRYRRVQLEQTSLDHVIVRVEPNETFEPVRDIPIVEKAYQDYFKDQFTVEVRIVDKISQTSAYKHKLVISELALKELRKHFNTTNVQQSSTQSRD